MPSRKRSFRVAEGEADDTESSLLHRIRNMWQFANLCQWIYTFGKAAKIDESIEIEVSIPLPSLHRNNAYFQCDIGTGDGMPQAKPNSPE